MRNLFKGLKLGLALLIMGLGVFALIQSPGASTKAEMAALRTVTDGAGRTVQIPRHPQRVVALNVSNVDLYYAAGGAVVGRPNSMALPPALIEKLQNIPSVGETPNPNTEKIIALKPDLVLAANVPYHHNLIPVLQQAGIPVYIQSLDTYQQIVNALRFYGELTGKPHQVDKVVDTIENQLRQVNEKSKDKPRPKVLIIWGSPESFSMALPGSFSGDLVKRLQAVNIAEGQEALGGNMQYAPLSLEFVAKENPDVILLITHSSEEKISEKFRKELAEHPAWQGMKAVKEGQVHKLPYQLFAVNPGTRVGEAIEYLSALLYAEVKK